MQKSILLKAPLLTRSGYGEQARFALRALKSREDLFDIYIQPLEWGQTSWIFEDSEERRWIDQKIEKTIHHIQNEGKFDMSLQVTIPNEWSNAAEYNIGYTAAVETTKIAHQWIEPSNAMNKIITVSNHSKNVMINTVYDAMNQTTGEKFVLQVKTPTEAVNYPVKTFEDLEPLELDLSTRYNFLCVAQMGPRKNMENTIAWFIEEFHDDEDVGLVLKTNLAKNCQVDREISFGRISSVTQRYPDKKCKIHLLHGDMTDKEMHALYLSDKIVGAYSLTHGEGFGLPLFESAYMGTAVVAPGWSGQMDFLADENGKRRFYDVSYDLNHIQDEVVWEGVLIKESMWAYPREASAKQNLRQCLNDYKEKKNEDVCEYALELRERFSEEKMYAKFVEEVSNVLTTDGTVVNIFEDLNVEDWLGNLEIENYE